MKLKTKYTYEDDTEIGYGFPADEAKSFIKTVRPFLVDKTLKQILVPDFYYGGEDADETETYPEWEKRTRAKYKEERFYNFMEWNDPIILKIGNEQLEISFSQPDRYIFSFNTVEAERIIDTSKISLISARKMKDSFLDVTCLYDKTVIGQKIKDIDLVCDKDSDEPNDEYVDK
ncbi:MAG: hypothetical protein J5716_07845, partial [Alphaproteobacteria bacterium]|nr:hypothetical protein [Alphaproteobacteria bacterium]